MTTRKYDLRTPELFDSLQMCVRALNLVMYTGPNLDPNNLAPNADKSSFKSYAAEVIALAQLVGEAASDIETKYQESYDNC